MADERLLVTVCTYNERENLPALIPEILQYAPQADVLVIDDNSPDGTGQIADEMAARDPRVKVMHRPGKLGLGTATLAGFRFAIDHDYTWVLNLDADFSHHPRYIPSLMGCARVSDVVIGSRYMPGGGVVGWGLKRKLMSRGINFYARLFLRLKTRDNSGAFRCFRVSRLREIDFDQIISRGYAIQEEILYRCRKIGCTFAETPIVFDDRRFGQSKINMREAALALWIIFRLGVFGR